LVARAFVTMAFESGMRMTEVLLCRWSWLDRARGYISVPGAVAKNVTARICDFTGRTATAVDELPRHLSNDHIYVNPDTGDLYDRRWLYELYHRAVQASSIRGPSGEMPVFHDLRR